MPTDVSYLADQTPTGPSGDAIAVVTSDLPAGNFTVMPRALYIGVGGDVSVLMRNGVTLLFKNAQAGSTLPIRVQRVNTASTTATNIIGLL